MPRVDDAGTRSGTAKHDSTVTITPRIRAETITITSSDFPPLLEPIHVPLYKYPKNKKGVITWSAVEDNIGIGCGYCNKRWTPTRGVSRFLKEMMVSRLDFLTWTYLVNKGQDVTPALQERLDVLARIVDPGKHDKSAWENWVDPCPGCPLDKGDEECACCPACGSVQTRVKRRKKEFNIWKCTSCGHEYQLIKGNCSK